MSDTPETDAQLTTFISISKLKKHFVNRTGTVSVEFTRGLERERNKARDAVFRLRKQRAIARNFGQQVERERDKAVFELGAIQATIAESKQAERIRELEEQLKVKEFLLNEAIKDLEAEQSEKRDQRRFMAREMGTRAASR